MSLDVNIKPKQVPAYITTNTTEAWEFVNRKLTIRKLSSCLLVVSWPVLRVSNLNWSIIAQLERCGRTVLLFLWSHFVRQFSFRWRVVISVEKSNVTNQLIIDVTVFSEKLASGCLVRSHIWPMNSMLRLLTGKLYPMDVTVILSVGVPFRFEYWCDIYC